MKSEEQVKIAVLLLVMLASLALFDNANDYMHAQITGAAVSAQDQSKLKIVAIDNGPTAMYISVNTNRLTNIKIYVKEPGDSRYEVDKECNKASYCTIGKDSVKVGQEIKYYAIEYDDKGKAISNTLPTKKYTAFP